MVAILPTRHARVPIYIYTYIHNTHTQELDRFISQVLPDRLKALEDWLLRIKVRALVGRM